MYKVIDLIIIMKKITQEQVSLIAKELCTFISETKIFTFSGSLGAGKTTLVQTILKELGIKEPVTSPTYTYVNVYRHNGITFYHFDLYRLDSLDDFIQAGFDEYLYQPNSHCFIEWPEIIEDLIKKDVCKVVLEYDTQDSRFISVNRYK